MKRSICHYSFHRRFVDEHWSLDRFADEVRALGVEGIDFHARMLDPIDSAAERIMAALARSGLILSSLSLSTDFNKGLKEDFAAQIDGAGKWLDVAVRVNAPVCRVFGGNLAVGDRDDAKARQAAWQRMIDGVGAVTREAARRGVILALENHGSLPCTAQEQVQAIKTIDSPFLRATVDVGNYMAGGQEGHEGTAIAAPYAAYVHFKDNKKIPDAAKPCGWGIEACVVGEGDVDLPACLAALRQAGYDGFVGLEYEGPESEVTGVPRSAATLRRLVI
jgi:sugar phosphate isomerase/epimerase